MLALEAVDKALIAKDLFDFGKAVNDGDTDKATEIGVQLALEGGVEAFGGNLIPGSVLAIKIVDKLKTLGKTNLADAVETSINAIPGIDKPFRRPNSDFPANENLISAMNDLPHNCSGMDCSEIAEKLFDISGGNGKILNVSPPNGKSLDLMENGDIDGGFAYHQVFTDGKYVYDPRLSDNAIPKGDWEKHIKGLNPGSVIKELKQ